MDTFMKVAVDAARQAGALLKDNWQKAKTIEIKTDIVDLVTNVDKASDALITGILRSRFPDHQIIAEESAVSGKPSAYRWYIDPIDGTTNFAHSFPHFAVSIGLMHESQIIVGVVYDPIKDELLCDARERGNTQ